jgi:hypothetical protein
MAEHVPGVHVPDAVIARIAAAADQRAEGRRVCIETIHALQRLEGVAGVHLMGHRNEATLAQIIVEAGCAAGAAAPSPRPAPNPHRFHRTPTTETTMAMSEWTDEERQLVEWLADMNEDDALPLANRMLLKDKADPMRVLDLCRAAMDIVGKRFEEGEYFLPELVLAGEMLDTIGAVAKPLIKAAGGGAAQTHGRC